MWTIINYDSIFGCEKLNLCSEPPIKPTLVLGAIRNWLWIIISHNNSNVKSTRNFKRGTWQPFLFDESFVLDLNAQKRIIRSAWKILPELGAYLVNSNKLFFFFRKCLGYALLVWNSKIFPCILRCKPTSAFIRWNSPLIAQSIVLR